MMNSPLCRPRHPFAQCHRQDLVQGDRKHLEACRESQIGQPDEDLKTCDAEFVNVDQATLIDLILAANYLNIKSLLDLTHQTVADMT